MRTIALAVGLLCACFLQEGSGVQLRGDPKQKLVEDKKVAKKEDEKKDKVDKKADTKEGKMDDKKPAKVAKKDAIVGAGYKGIVDKVDKKADTKVSKMDDQKVAAHPLAIHTKNEPVAIGKPADTTSERQEVTNHKATKVKEVRVVTKIQESTKKEGAREWTKQPYSPYGKEGEAAEKAAAEKAAAEKAAAKKAKEGAAEKPEAFQTWAETAAAKTAAAKTAAAKKAKEAAAAKSAAKKAALEKAKAEKDKEATEKPTALPAAMTNGADTSDTPEFGESKLLVVVLLSLLAVLMVSLCVSLVS